MNQFHGEFSEEEALAKALAASLTENVKSPTEKQQKENKNEKKRSTNSRKSLEKENNNNTQIKCLAPECSKMFRADVMPR